MRPAARREPLPGELKAFGIHDERGDALNRLFMSHPTLEDRIAALERGR